MSRRVLPFLAIALLLGSACASGASSSKLAVGGRAGTNASEATTVHLPKSYRFEPETIEVDAGTTVTWVNEDDFPHTVHLLDGSGVDKKLGVGDSASITFDETGVYRYDCSLHPTQMNGSVVVRESAS